MAMDAREARETREARDRRDERDYRMQEPSLSLELPIPPGYMTNPQHLQGNEITVIPGLPNPNSGRLYQLQVGAFSSLESATQAYQLLRAAGFDTVQEQGGNVYRVYARGVPAQVVQYAAQRLGVMGFRQVWVRE